MRPHPILQVLAAAALIAVPSFATAAPDQNTPGNNGCNGQWVNGQCVNNGNNGRWNGNNGRGNNNGRWNNNGNANNRDADRERQRERERERERWQREHQNGAYNGGYYNNGQYNNGGYYNNGQYNNGQYNGGYYNNGQYNNGYGNGYGGNGTLNGTVSSFSPYNLYLSNGLHVVLHDGTVINPRGTNLTGGQRVRIIGYRNQDGTFSANEIDVIGSGYNNGGYYRR